MRLVFFLFVVFFNLGKATALELDVKEKLFPDEITDDMKYITVYNQTQLGNACFVTATGLGYALDNGYAFAIEKTFKERFPLVFHQFPLYEVKKPTNKISHGADSLFIAKINESTLIDGYSNSDFWFYRHKNAIIELFKPTDEIKTHIEKKYSEFLQNDNKYVGLHLRTVVQKGELKSFYTIDLFTTFGVCPEFYTEAMNLFPEDTVFVVFSDNTKVAKKLLSKLRRKFIFQQNSSVVEDFYLMSMMKRMIIPSSSFSSFACFINPNPDKVIVKPKNSYGSYMFDPAFIILNTDYPSFGVEKWYNICKREYFRLGFDKDGVTSFIEYKSDDTNSVRDDDGNQSN